MKMASLANGTLNMKLMDALYGVGSKVRMVSPLLKLAATVVSISKLHHLSQPEVGLVRKVVRGIKMALLSFRINSVWNGFASMMVSIHGILY